MTRVACVLLALLALATPAFAVGPVVGQNCVIAWTPPTANTDGSALTGTLTYDLFLVSSVAQPTTPPATPTTTGITGADTTSLTAPPCRSLASGQWWAYVRAVENFGGSQSTSTLAGPSPFVLVGPNPPTSVNVR